eukprot:5128116-Amphidinium_carterae.2
MESGLAETRQIAVTRSVRRLTLSHRFNVAVLRSAVGTPSDPSGRLEELQDDFIGLPELMARYHTKQKPKSALLKDDVMPTLGDTAACPFHPARQVSLEEIRDERVKESREVQIRAVRCRISRKIQCHEFNSRRGQELDARREVKNHSTLVIRKSSVKLLLRAAAQKQWRITVTDIQAAFLDALVDVTEIMHVKPLIELYQRSGDSIRLSVDSRNDQGYVSQSQCSVSAVWMIYSSLEESQRSVGSHTNIGRVFNLKHTTHLSSATWICFHRRKIYRRSESVMENAMMESFFIKSVYEVYKLHSRVQFFQRHGMSYCRTATVRPDFQYAVKELSRNNRGPTSKESSAQNCSINLE